MQLSSFHDTISLPFTTPKLYLNFLFWYSLCIHLFFTALTTPSNLGGCVTDYQHCAETQGCSLPGCISTTFVYIVCFTTNDSPGYCRLRRQPCGLYFMYIYQLISIVLQSSRSCNSSHCKSLQLLRLCYSNCQLPIH